MARRNAGKARHSLISRRLSTAEQGLSSGPIPIWCGRAGGRP